MIVLDLRCHQDHRFEGWFGSSDAFEEQCARGLVSCPSCGSTDIERLPSAPYVQTRAAPTKPSVPVPAPAEARALAIAALRRLSRQAEDVGDRFPEEARRMHYGHSEARSIRGDASRDEVGELLEEGIMVLPVPPDEDLH
jgi:hypothetical protein